VLESLRIAALLHDIGEIGISEKVLATPRDAMSVEDYKKYQQHPLRGQMMIDEIEDLRPVGVLIRHHHENFDGSGFPDGLAGESIPLGARIIAYADHIDKVAQTCTAGLAEQALAKTAHLIGKDLDPALTPAFKRLTKYIYFAKSNESDLVEIELEAKELTPGMQLSRDVCSGSGILLLKRGTTLDENKVIAIQRNYRLDPPSHGVFVTTSG